MRTTPIPSERRFPAGRLGATAALALALAGATASSAAAEPPSIRNKRARAQAVLTQVRELDSRLEHAVEVYNFANVRLGRIGHALDTNRLELRIARRNLRRAQQLLAQRLVALYTSGGTGSVLEVILGAVSLGDLFDRIDTANRVSNQDTRIVREVSSFRARAARKQVELARARRLQRRIVGRRAAERAEIESQLAERERLLASIKDEIARLKAEERRRQERLRQQALARLQAEREAARRAAEEARRSRLPAGSRPQPVVGAAAITPEGVSAAPPSRYGGVVGIAMQYLGIPYRWGGASPDEGFDCSGLIMYVYAQVGVSLPHYAASQYTYGTPVSRDQLEPGDLVFFNGLGHNGIYIGNGQFIHAPHTGDVVKISSLSDSWYAATWVGARRL